MPVHHDPNFIIPFGEHKGKKISKLPTDYLQWGAKELKGSMQERFQLALRHRFKDFGLAMAQATIGLTMVSGFGHVSLKEAIEAFCSRHHVGPEKVHQYLALYETMKTNDSPTILVDYEKGQINVVIH